MTYLLISETRSRESMFFKSKKKEAEMASKEAKIQAVRQQTLKTIQKTTYTTNKLNDLLEDDTLGTTGFIFYATGGDKRVTK